MKKNNLWCGICFIAVGQAALAAALLWDSRLQSLLWGIAFGFMGSGVTQVWKYVKWTRPENAAVYREKLEQERIDLHDERKEMLRDKAGRYAYLLGLLVCMLGIFVLAVLGSLGVVEHYRLALFVLAAFAVLEYATGVWFYRWLSRRY